MPSLSNVTVADAMHEGIVYCEPDTSLREVAEKMANDRVHCVAVHARSYGESAEDRVWGIVSDLDLVRAKVQTDSSRTAGSIAHTPVITVRPSMALPDAAAAMLERHVSHVVVVDPDTHGPVGILSTLDLAGAIARDEGSAGS
jgi:CBS domain-containing protein